jgi:glycosyltransferase involved in cell wall biosynthesis
MSDYYEVIGISSNGTELKEVEENEGIRTISVEMTRRITIFKDIRATYRLYKILKKEKPLIVHTHTPKAGIVGMLAAWLARVPYRLHTVAGMPLLEAKGAKRILLDTVEKLTYNFATSVYPNSAEMHNIILKNKLTFPGKLTVIANGSSNGIDPSYFTPDLFTEAEKDSLRTELGVATNDVLFIFIGRLVKDKGIHELVKAFEDVNRDYPNTKLLLVGSFERDLDPLNDNTEQSIKTNKNILSIGFQSDVRPYLAISNIFVFPSYREGFPNVVMQAGAMGLPCIVTNINGCNEIIINDINGVIIPAKDMEKLQNAMLDLLQNREKQIKMASVAREMIKSRYEQSFVWKELLKVYQSLEK